MSSVKPDHQEQQSSEDIDSMSASLDSLQTRIDELKVQIELAKLDLRERATTQLDIAQNVCLAAHSKLRDARNDASANFDVIKAAVRKLIEDVKASVDAAQAVISRG